MRHKNRIKTSRLWFVAMMLCFWNSFSGCTKQAVMECPQEVELHVQAVNAENEDITDEGVVKGVSFYLFDKDKLFLKRVDVPVNKPLRLYFPDEEFLHVVSWGNLTENRAELPQLAKGTPMHQAVVHLLSAPTFRHKSSEAHALALTPDDLFYSYDEISLKSGSQTRHTVRMHRTVSAMTVTLRNLQSYANRYDENYSLVVRETYNTIDFLSRLIGEKVGYMPPSSFNKKKELIAPLFNMLPSHTGDGIAIDVYHDRQLITTIKKDSQGNPLRTQTGKVLNVLIDFKLQVNVEVSIPPWGTIHI